MVVLLDGTNMIEKILAYILACCNNSEFEQTTVAIDK